MALANIQSILQDSRGALLLLLLLQGLMGCRVWPGVPLPQEQAGAPFISKVLGAGRALPGVLGVLLGTGKVQNLGAFRNSPSQLEAERCGSCFHSWVPCSGCAGCLGCSCSLAVPGSVGRMLSSHILGGSEILGRLCHAPELWEQFGWVLRMLSEGL